MADSSDKTQPNANDVLRSRLRTMTPQLATSVKGNNVYIIADIMWSDKHISDFEKDEVLEMRHSGRDALRKLLDYAYARGGRSIMGIAHALRKIELHDLADQLYPADNVVVLPSATAGASLSMHLSLPRETLLKNFKRYCPDVVAILTKEGAKTLASRLFAEDMLLPGEKERVFLDVATATDAASHLADIVVKKSNVEVTLKFLDILQKELNQGDIVKKIMSQD